MMLTSELDGLQLAPIIGLWAFLFTGPLSEPDHIFAPVKRAIYWLLTGGKKHKIEGWRKELYLPLIGCQNCHAGQVALWWQVATSIRGEGFDISFIILSIGSAFFINAIAEFLEKK